ncbi:helix-turn-helix domain-containing protein [Actinoplanes italicus]|uniref:helix-turn-helix domain-containing protein n=1 Tax=Actinoplanes italicus TaxID=113567 RepID=UPI0035A23801
MLSKPDNWIVRTEQIAKANGCGRDSIQSALREIEAAGYLVRTETRNAAGQ